MLGDLPLPVRVLIISLCGRVFFCWKVQKLRKFLQISTLWKGQLFGNICSKYLNRTIPSCWEKPKTEGITTIHTEMVGFFGTSAVLLPRNGSVHHELIRPHHDRPRGVIRCCSTARGRTRDYYYQVLGIAVHSTPQEIKDAYRKLQKQHHPDIAGYKVHPFPSSSFYHLLFYSSVHPFFFHS